MMIPIHTSLTMLCQVMFSLVLGWIIGYERYFRGRASGTQVYCLVSMASCAVTVFAGHPTLWYAGTSQVAVADPTHIAGNILTGIGFLGAGIIVQSGVNVRGLTTAASVWATASLGMMVGVGFYEVAAGLTVLFLLSMTLITSLESWLPARSAIVVSLRYESGHVVDVAAIEGQLARRGLVLQVNSAAIHLEDGCYTLNFVTYAKSVSFNHVLSHLAQEMGALSYVKSFDIAQSNRA